jgi:hypothetical protein
LSFFVRCSGPRSRLRLLVHSCQSICPDSGLYPTFTFSAPANTYDTVLLSLIFPSDTTAISLHQHKRHSYDLGPRFIDSCFFSYFITPFQTALLVHSCQSICPDSACVLRFSYRSSSLLISQQYPDTNINAIPTIWVLASLIAASSHSIFHTSRSIQIPRMIAQLKNILMHSILSCSRGRNASQ